MKQIPNIADVMPRWRKSAVGEDGEGDGGADSKGSAIRRRYNHRQYNLPLRSVRSANQTPKIIFSVRLFIGLLLSDSRTEVDQELAFLSDMTWPDRLGSRQYTSDASRVVPNARRNQN